MRTHRSASAAFTRAALRISLSYFLRAPPGRTLHVSSIPSSIAGPPDHHVLHEESVAPVGGPDGFHPDIKVDGGALKLVDRHPEREETLHPESRREDHTAASLARVSAHAPHRAFARL